MKNISLILICFFYIINNYGQSFFQLNYPEDGVGISDSLKIKDKIGDLLKEFPDIFGDTFFVYDYMVFRDKNDVWLGVEMAPDSMFGDSGNSFLWMTRYENHSNSRKLGVALRLPESNFLKCMEDQYPGFTRQVTLNFQTRIDSILKKDSLDWNKMELKVLEELKAYLTEKKLNCENRTETDNVVDPCFLNAEDFAEFLRRNFFMLDPIKIVSDEDFNLAPRSKNFRLALDNNLNIISREEGSDPKDMDFYIFNFVKDQEVRYIKIPQKPPTISHYKLKFPRDCHLFQATWEEYKNDPADEKLFFVVVNVDNNSGWIAFNFSFNDQ